MRKRQPVPGWLTQILLLLTSWAMFWVGQTDAGSVFLTGSLIVGVLRQIEKGKRDD